MTEEGTLFDTRGAGLLENCSLGKREAKRGEHSNHGWWPIVGANGDGVSCLCMRGHILFEVSRIRRIGGIGNELKLPLRDQVRVTVLGFYFQRDSVRSSGIRA